MLSTNCKQPKRSLLPWQSTAVPSQPLPLAPTRLEALRLHRHGRGEEEEEEEVEGEEEGEEEEEERGEGSDLHGEGDRFDTGEEEVALGDEAADAATACVFLLGEALAARDNLLDFCCGEQRR